MVESENLIKIYIYEYAKDTWRRKLLMVSVKRRAQICVGARMQISMKNLETWVTVTSAISKVIKHMIAGLEPLEYQDLKVNATTVRIMDTEPSNVDLSLCSHQKN